MDNIEFSKKFKSMLAGSKDDFDLVYREMKKPVFTVIYRITGNSKKYYKICSFVY